MALPAVHMDRSPAEEAQTFHMSPWQSDADEDGERDASSDEELGQDSPPRGDGGRDRSQRGHRLFSIEAQFEALWRPRPVTHILDTPKSGRRRASSTDRMAERFLQSRRQSTASDYSNYEFDIEEEFGAFTAARALHELGPGRHEAESAWRMCLIRERLKNLQRGKGTATAWSWAPALKKRNQSPVVEEEAEEPPQADAELWPSILGDGGPVSPRASLRRTSSAPSFVELPEPCCTDGDEDLEGPSGPPRPQASKVQPRRPAAPPASDPFFHFGEIDLKEQEQQELLVRVLHSWRACLVQDIIAF